MDFLYTNVLISPINCIFLCLFIREVQTLVIKYYANSLYYGCKYVYQSLPRLLSIWFDYAAIGAGNAPGGASVTQESQPEDWSPTVSQMHHVIRKWKLLLLL
jgi:hypothetical protein